MIGIQCKSKQVFCAIVNGSEDAEWHLQVAYYKAQGCTVVDNEKVRFGSCTCEHCETIEHNFEELIEEIKEQ